MRKLLFTLLLIGGMTPILSAQLVVTVAGTLEQVGANDGPAFDATFNNPHGIATDAMGNVYVADRFGHIIRKITPEGTVSTLAGSGEMGSANGVGAEASFNEPWGICVGSDGNIYVADTRNNRIRKITPTGLVTTYAGSGNYGTSDGFGVLATFGNPTGLEMDEEGNLYVADHLTHLIRRIDVNGFVTTIAGTPYTPGAADGTGSEAKFFRPYGLTLDNEGNILVADEWNHLIRRVTPDGEVSTLAGTGIIGNNNGAAEIASFNYPWDITVDSLGVIYVADGYNQEIRKIFASSSAPVTYTVAPFAGVTGVSGGSDGFGNSATFNGATGLAYYRPTGEIFVADAYNQLVRKIINLETQAVGLLVTSEAGTTFCEGEILTAQAIPNTCETYTFYINGTIQQSGDSPGFLASDLTAGNYSLQVLASDTSGSYYSTLLDIEVIPDFEPTITTIGETTFFAGDSVILLASEGTEFLWSTGETTQTITVLEEGTYTVEVTNSFGCIGISEEIAIEVINFSAAPVASFVGGTDGILCYGEVAQLTSSYSTNNQWYLDGWAIDGATAPMLDINVAGTYQVQVTDSLGFNLLSNEVEVTVLPPVIDDFSADRITIDTQNAEVVFSAAVNEAVNYLWNFGDPFSGANNQSTLATPTHLFSAPGMYNITLMASNAEGCVDTLTKQNFIEYKETAPEERSDVIYIPNTFTPNGDDVNDYFFVRGETIAEVEMNIYNQWGELIFSTLSKEEGWDGKRLDKPVQNGTYAYMAKIRLLSGELEIRSGYISVVR